MKEYGHLRSWSSTTLKRSTWESYCSHVHELCLLRTVVTSSSWSCVMLFVSYVLLWFRQVDLASCLLSATYCCHFVKLTLRHAFCLLHTVFTSSNWSCVMLSICYVQLSLRQVDLAWCFLSATYCCHFIKLILRHAFYLLRTVVTSSSWSCVMLFVCYILLSLHQIVSYVLLWFRQVDLASCLLSATYCCHFVKLTLRHAFCLLHTVFTSSNWSCVMLSICYVQLSLRQVDLAWCFLSATYCCHFIKLVLRHAFCLLCTAVTSSSWSCIMLFVFYVLLSFRQVDLGSCFWSATYCCYFVKLILCHAFCLWRTVVISSSWSCVMLFVRYILLSICQVDLASCFFSATYCCHFVKLILCHAFCLLCTVVTLSSWSCVMLFSCYILLSFRQVDLASCLCLLHTVVTSSSWSCVMLSFCYLQLSLRQVDLASCFFPATYCCHFVKLILRHAFVCYILLSLRQVGLA